MNILNMSINNYVINNKSIIAYLVYYIERLITKCQYCNFSSSHFNVRMDIIFALEDIRQLKFRKQIFRE